MTSTLLTQPIESPVGGLCRRAAELQNTLLPERTTPLPLISVVVCTYNRAHWLGEAVRSLFSLQTGGQFRYELVLIDNASTDATASVIAALVEESPVPCRGVHEPRPGVSCARNRGISEAQGDWIAFFDDDQFADERWLAELWSLAQRQRCGSVGGSVWLRWTGGEPEQYGPFARVLLGETVGREQEQRYTHKVAPGAGNWMIARAVLTQVGPFDESLQSAGEDTDLYRRIRGAGCESWFTPTALVWHRIPEERLRPESLLWTADRIGGHVARREQRELSALAVTGMLLARIVQLLLAAGPQRIRAALRVDPARQLDNRCWRAFLGGYFRWWWQQTGLQTRAQRELVQQQDFRSRGPQGTRNVASTSATETVTGLAISAPASPSISATCVSSAH